MTLRKGSVATSAFQVRRNPSRLMIFWNVFIDLLFQKKSCPHLFLCILSAGKWCSVVRRAIFWRRVHHRLMMAVESKLFSWRSKGMLSYGMSLKPNSNLECAPNHFACIFHDFGTFSPSKVSYQKWFIFAKLCLRQLFITKIKIIYLSPSESDCALLVFPLIYHLILIGCIFEQPTNS